MNVKKMKIYMIGDINTKNVYIGATKNSLASTLSDFRKYHYMYNNFEFNGGISYMPVFKVFDRVKPSKIKIKLLSNCHVETIQEVNVIKKTFTNNIECVNNE